MQSILHVRTRSELVADAVREVMAELRLIDADELIGAIKAGQWANISDLVQSSAELYLEEGALTFACAGDYEASWGMSPVVSLDMEFQRDDITVFFTVKLGASDDCVLIRDVWFASQPSDAADGTAALAAALAGARRKASVSPGR